MNLIYGFFGFLLLLSYLTIPTKMYPSSEGTTEVTNEEVLKEDSIEPFQKTLNVTLTCYQPLVSQCNDNPLITSDGSEIDLNKLERGDIKWAAVSRDILSMFPKNTPRKIYIEGFGEFEVHDTMNKRWSKRVDILIHPNSTQRICMKDVKITMVD